MPAPILFIDTEWGYRGGRIGMPSAFEPVVLCAVGAGGGRSHFWGHETDRLAAFFSANRDATFVAHYAVAEMSYLLRQRIPLPERWFCTYVGWRRVKNRPGKIEASLIHALAEEGLAHLAPATKEEIRDKILHLRYDPDDPADRDQIVRYCLSDCDGVAALHPRLVDKIDAAAMDCWMAYAKAVAAMELRGVPADCDAARRIIMHRRAIGDHLIAQVNRVASVYDDGVFKAKKFFRWAEREGVHWPWSTSATTGRPMRSLDDDTLEEMEHRHPFIAELRQTRKTLNALKKAAIQIDAKTGRHHFGTSVFRSITSRNQPRAFLFSAPKWFRWLATPPSPEHVLVYVDYVAQEIAIAAALSDDPAMRAMYEANDPHIWFAVTAGAAPEGATKETHPGVRKIYKTIGLGTLYGLSAWGAAQRLGITVTEAEAILRRHRELFSRYWSWSENMVAAAYTRGEIRTRCGWGCLVPRDSNPRTWQNWPIQATGADVMRLTVVYLSQQGASVLAPIHDGFLMSCHRSQVDDLRAAVEVACRAAVEQALGRAFPMRRDFTVYDDRFRDEDGEAQWLSIAEALQRIGDVSIE